MDFVMSRLLIMSIVVILMIVWIWFIHKSHLKREDELTLMIDELSVDISNLKARVN